MNNNFTKICNYSDLKENQGRRFIIDDVDVAVFKVDGVVYALNNICLHQKHPIIHEGIIENGKVSCPLHNWTFYLQTGKIENGTKGLDRYDVKIENDEVWIKVFQKGITW